MRFERIHITAFLAIAAFAWGTILLIQGTAISWEHAKPFTVVVSVLGFVGFCFERYLWRWRLLQGWFVKRPDLRGTWRVELNSSYVPPGGRERGTTVVGYTGVKQTLSSLAMHFMTPESESWFIASHIRASPSGDGYQVIAVYSNEPNVHLRRKRISETHNGAVIISTHGEGIRPDTLDAKYWTDRRTLGTMTFTCHTEKVFTRFADAHGHFESASPGE